MHTVLSSPMVAVVAGAATFMSGPKKVWRPVFSMYNPALHPVLQLYSVFRPPFRHHRAAKWDSGNRLLASHRCIPQKPPGLRDAQSTDAL